MKLKTRLITAFVTVSVMPILLTTILIWGLCHYQIHEIEETYGISGATYKDFSNSVQVLNRLTEKPYHTLKDTANFNPEKFDSVEYLETTNDMLKTQNSYLLIKKAGRVDFVGGDMKNAKKLIYQLPSYGEHDSTSENGVYYGGDVQALVKQIDFKYTDKTEGSAFIVTDVSNVIPEVKQVMLDILIAVILILVITAALLIFWIYKGITYPLGKMQKAAKNIKEGNLDFQIVPEVNDELGQLCQAFEDMRKRLKTNAEEKITYDKENK